MKRPIVKSVWLNVSRADYFEDEMAGYMEAQGEYWLNDEDLDRDEGHPFTLTVELSGAWIDFNDHGVALGEEKAERAILSLLREEVKEMRGAIEDRNTY